MPTKIRLARHGRKKRPFYHIIIADSRSPRDGRYIERIGSYNPMTNPATIDLNFDRALYWLQTGAQPTHTCRAILSYKGVLIKKHLLEGVKKGAFHEKTADKKFKDWISQKEKTIQTKIDKLSKEDTVKQKEIFKQEEEIKNKRAQEIAAKKIDLEKQLASEKEKLEEKAETTEDVKSDEVKEAKEESSKNDKTPKKTS